MNYVLSLGRKKVVDSEIQETNASAIFEKCSWIFWADYSPRSFWAVQNQ